MKNLSDYLKKKTFSADSARIDEQTIFHICRKALDMEYGTRGVENITPKFYQTDKRRLFLTVRTSPWANEVWLGRKRLLKRINTLLDAAAVLEIVVTAEP